MKNKSSYNFEEEDILLKETVRLDKMGQHSKMFELQSLIELGLKDNTCILDLGCGTGIIDFEIAKHFKHSKIICFDRNFYLINKTKDVKIKKLISNIDFIVGDAEEIPIANESIDFCYSRIVFQHLKRPQKVIEEIHRITKTNGIIVIADIDDSGLILYPEPKGFGKYIKNVQIRQKKLGGDRFIGRKLYSLLKTHFVDVDYKIVPFYNKVIGNQNFIDITMGYKSHIIKHNEDLLKNLKKWEQDENSIGSLLCFVAYGRKK